MEKDPLLTYEIISREMNLIVYSNIRVVLKQFFDQFELSLQRLSLKLSQAISIFKVFENFMFIHTINLSGNSIRLAFLPSIISISFRKSSHRSNLRSINPTNFRSFKNIESIEE